MKQPIVAYAKSHPERAGDRAALHGDRAGHGHAEGALPGPRGGADYLAAFVEEMKASGFVADALKRSNQPDAAVAPPAGR